MKLLNKGEIWRPIKGFEKLYEISSLGRVKSLARPMHLPIEISSDLTAVYIRLGEIITQMGFGGEE